MPKLDAAACIKAEYTLPPSGRLARWPANTTILDAATGHKACWHWVHEGASLL